MSVLRFFLLFIAIASVAMGTQVVAEEKSPSGFVAAVSMDMMILPGTGEYLKQAIKFASSEKAELLIITLDTPGGMLRDGIEKIKLLEHYTYERKNYTIFIRF